MRRETIRTISIVLFILVTLFYLSPLVLPKDVDEETGIASLKKPLPFWTEKMLRLGLDLQGGMEINLYVDLSEIPRQDQEFAIRGAVEVIQNRIDQFGVAEPTIQQVGENRIVVQLPGVTDFQRAKDLIGRTAMLHFQLVATDDETRRVVDQMDLWLSQNHDKYPALERELSFGEESSPNLFDTAENVEDDPDAENEVDDFIYTGTEWHRDILSFLLGSGGQMAVSHEYKPLVRSIIQDVDFQNAVPAGSQILLGRENSLSPRDPLGVYVVYSNIELSGTHLQSAETSIGDRSGFQGARPYVSLRFNREGARIFERATAQNIGRQLAIVLDDIVYVAPVIQDRISGGEAMITGNYTMQEANDLTIVLRAGSLPAPVEIGEERTVGPSLGSDSIMYGLRAGIIGLCLIMLFMIFYYKLSGAIACVALLLNTGFVLAALTFLEATLTLPGIAGLILTVGMAVDANVLIFERIRDELKNDKKPRAAVEAGFARAMVTIIDSNLTSLIVAVSLFQFGTGPIKGFAVTFGIGIMASFFTAIVVVRAIFDTFITNKNRDKLSI